MSLIILLTFWTCRFLWGAVFLFIPDLWISKTRFLDIHILSCRYPLISLILLDIQNSTYGYPKIMLNFGYPKIELWISIIICSYSGLKRFLPTSVMSRFVPGLLRSSVASALCCFGLNCFNPRSFRSNSVGHFGLFYEPSVRVALGEVGCLRFG